MAVVPVPTTGAISINDIKAAFPTINSNNLNAYKGKLWYKSDNSRGYFPSGDNAYISMSMFRDTREVSPVVAGSATYTSGTSITLPAMFNTLTVTVYGASGGGGGGSIIRDSGYYAGGGGGTGGSGNTSFGPLNGMSLTAGAGGGGGGGRIDYSSTNNVGTTGSNATIASYTNNAGIRSGGGGGSQGGGSYQVQLPNPLGGGPLTFTYYSGDGGRGGNGGKDVKEFLNITSLGYDGIKAFYGASVSISLASGGTHGIGSAYYDGNNVLHKAGDGGDGSGGYIVISWT